MSSVGDVRAAVFAIADEAPVAQALAAADEITHAMRALRSRLHDTGDREVEVVLRQLEATAHQALVAAEALDVAAGLCRSYAASV